MHAFDQPLSRRNLLISGAVAGAGALTAGIASSTGTKASAGNTQTSSIPDVYVLVLDSMNPKELIPELTPNLTRLAQAGVIFSNGRAISVAETIHNHVAMVSGVYPDRSGVPANTIYDRQEHATRKASRPADLLVPTVLDTVHTQLGYRTAAVLSKSYLHSILAPRASVSWTPGPILPTGHAPDIATYNALCRTVVDHHPKFCFVNFGDIDRVGHLDATGIEDLKLARNLALRQTDQLVANFVTFLRMRQLWQRSVIIVLADHSMDWSPVQQHARLSVPFHQVPSLRGKYKIVGNGTAALIYYTGPSEQKAAALQKMLSLTRTAPGIAKATPIQQTRLGPKAGDILVECKPHWRYDDANFDAFNPILGNHGNETTLPIVYFMTGGHSCLRHGITINTPVQTLDVAPTVSLLLRTNAPAGGWDGKALKDAFHLPQSPSPVLSHVFTGKQ